MSEIKVAPLQAGDTFLTFAEIFARMESEGIINRRVLTNNGKMNCALVLLPEKIFCGPTTAYMFLSFSERRRIYSFYPDGNLFIFKEEKDLVEPRMITEIES